MVITIVNDTFGTITGNADLKAWITNLPTGLTATAKTAVEAGSTIASIGVSGTPTAVSSGALAITIPATALTGGEAITVTANPNAKFAITASSQSGPNWDAINWSDTNAVIGTAAAGLTSSSTDKRAKEMATGDLATDALVWYIENKIETPYKQDIDFAYTNGGGLQNNGLAAGPITVGNATSDVVKSDTLKVFSVTGAQIKALLIANSTDMTQVSKEVKYTINIPASGDVTITALTINGTPVEDGTVYRASSGSTPTGATDVVTIPDTTKFNTVIPYYIYHKTGGGTVTLSPEPLDRITITSQ
ncbi:MAG: 5'-nucleotidase C-terminal domain-containing protein [Treponema sp.]|nr:5'-nucleotidase C-terminal domain-containing protein [Treponema sp.]